MARAPYDEIAHWYEHEFRGDGEDRLGIRSVVRELLGPGSGSCLEIGCGTGTYAATVRDLGWTPLGIDISAGMLGYARTRLPVVQADATQLPFGSATASAVIAVMVHTDMPQYPDVVREAARVLRPGGVFVHVGVHPCFCGGFADRTDPGAVVIRPGYLDGHWAKESWSETGVRAKVGASHYPLPQLMHSLLDAGLEMERLTEAGGPTPAVLGLRARLASPSDPAKQSEQPWPSARSGGTPAPE